MLDMDYKNADNNYILNMFFQIEERLYIYVIYKDNVVSKIPFSIHNYSAITTRIEKQFDKFGFNFF